MHLLISSRVSFERAGADGTPAPTDAMIHDHIEIIVVVLGTAAATGNTSESRASYPVSSLRFGHRFADAIMHRRGHRTLTVDREQLSETLPEDPMRLLLPQCF